MTPFLLDTVPDESRNSTLERIPWMTGRMLQKVLEGLADSIQPVFLLAWGCGKDKFKAAIFRPSMSHLHLVPPHCWHLIHGFAVLTVTFSFLPGGLPQVPEGPVLLMLGGGDGLSQLFPLSSSVPSFLTSLGSKQNPKNKTKQRNASKFVLKGVR